MSDFSDALNAFSKRFAEVKAQATPAQTEDAAIAQALERFHWLQPFVQAIDAKVREADPTNRVFIVGPSFNVADRKVSGRIFAKAPQFGEKVIHFIIQGSMMRLGGVDAANSLSFTPDDQKSATTLIAEEIAGFFGKL